MYHGSIDRYENVAKAVAAGLQKGYADVTRRDMFLLIQPFTAVTVRAFVARYLNREDGLSGVICDAYLGRKGIQHEQRDAQFVIQVEKNTHPDVQVYLFEQSISCRGGNPTWHRVQTFT